MTERQRSSAAALPRMSPRRPDSHKGDFGRALIVSGSRGMSGAAGLAGMAALRTGAGLVTLAVPDVCLDTVASFEPSYMTLALASDANGRTAAAARPDIEKAALTATCIACGPGIGRSAELNELVAWLYESLPQPAVFDADALNALATQPQRLNDKGGPRVLTPHPGEFRRLVGDESLSVEECRSRAADIAARRGVVVVLKGRGSLITDGRQTVRNETGNPGMATGGSGDVLTGIITALICQGLAPFEAARLGVHVHGLAGDLAAEKVGEISLIASDLLRTLPKALQQAHAG